MTTIVRKAVDSDLRQIQSCADAAYSIYIARIGLEPAPMVADFAASIDKDEIYIAEDTGRIHGFVVFHERDDHVQLENVAVRPEFQKRGIGLLLINFVEQKAREKGSNRVELYTNVRMTENLGMYPRLGYQEFDRRFEDGFERIYFRKTL